MTDTFPEQRELVIEDIMDMKCMVNSHNLRVQCHDDASVHCMKVKVIR